MPSAKYGCHPQSTVATRKVSLPDCSTDDFISNNYCINYIIYGSILVTFIIIVEVTNSPHSFTFVLSFCIFANLITVAFEFDKDSF